MAEYTIEYFIICYCVSDHGIKVRLGAVRDSRFEIREQHRQADSSLHLSFV